MVVYVKTLDNKKAINDPHNPLRYQYSFKMKEIVKTSVGIEM